MYRASLWSLFSAFTRKDATFDMGSKKTLPSWDLSPSQSILMQLFKMDFLMPLWPSHPNRTRHAYVDHSMHSTKHFIQKLIRQNTIQPLSLGLCKIIRRTRISTKNAGKYCTKTCKNHDQEQRTILEERHHIE